MANPGDLTKRGQQVPEREPPPPPRNQGGPPPRKTQTITVPIAVRYDVRDGRMSRWTQRPLGARAARPLAAASPMPGTSVLKPPPTSATIVA